MRVCEQFPVVCPNRCKTGHLQRARVQQHLLDCPLEIVSCEYAEMGCGVRLPRSEMREHVRESGQDHLLKMCAASLSLSRELSRKVEEKEQQITELHRDMRRREEKMSGDMKRMEEKISSDMRRMEERMKENEERMNASLREREMRQQQQMKEMEAKVAMQMKMELGENERKMTVSMTGMEGRMRNRMEVGEGRTQQLLGRMEGVIEENRKEMKAIEVINTSVVNVGRELCVVKSQVAEIRGETAVTVCIPPVEYTIHNFSVLKAQDKEWRSPPLYTHRGGYKMCIGVWPNGVDGICLHGNSKSYPLPKQVPKSPTVTVTTGKGTHVSVVVYTMRDANTETLEWRKDMVVAIEVMDQTSGRWEREYVDRSRRCKPETEYIESGVHFQYISHSELAPYRKYDCLCIRISKFSA